MRSLLNLIESDPRYERHWKGKDGSYYLELQKDGSERSPVYTYGPFTDIKAIDDFIYRKFTNPGSSFFDRSESEIPDEAINPLTMRSEKIKAPSAQKPAVQSPTVIDDKAAKKAEKKAAEKLKTSIAVLLDKLAFKRGPPIPKVLTPDWEESLKQGYITINGSVVTLTDLGRRFWEAGVPEHLRKGAS